MTTKPSVQTIAASDEDWPRLGFAYSYMYPAITFVGDSALILYTLGEGDSGRYPQKVCKRSGGVTYL